MRELDSDDAVYILEDLDKEDQDEILDQLPALDRAALSRSLDYPEESAGRRMQTEFVAVPAFWTRRPAPSTICARPRTCPSASTRCSWSTRAIASRARCRSTCVLRTKPAVAIADILSDEWHQVTATDDQEDVARLFERYNWVSAAGGRRRPGAWSA